MKKLTTLIVVDDRYDFVTMDSDIRKDFENHDPQVFFQKQKFSLLFKTH